MRNVSRAWAYETGLAAGVELGSGLLRLFVFHPSSDSALEIPVNEYYEYFGPDYELDVKPSNTEDVNSPEYLERVKNIVLENLRKLKGPPSVQMTGIPVSSDRQLYLFVWDRYPKDAVGLRDG